MKILPIVHRLDINVMQDKLQFVDTESVIEHIRAAMALCKDDDPKHAHEVLRHLIEQL